MPGVMRPAASGGRPPRGAGRAWLALGARAGDRRGAVGGPV